MICDQNEVFIGISKFNRKEAGFELHNPTAKTLECEVKNAPAMAEVKNFSLKISLPAGSSRIVTIGADGKAAIK